MYITKKYKYLLSGSTVKHHFFNFQNLTDEKMKIYCNAIFSVLAYSTSSPGVVSCLDII